MPTIAELTIKVNTTDLDKAKKSLDDLAKAAGGLGDATLPTFVPPEESKKVRDLSAAIDDQRRKLKAIENQRKALRDSDLSSTNPQEYTRLNQVLDTRVEIINRQGNALDRLYREEQKITEQQVRRQAQIVSAQNTEQAAIDATLSKLSTRYKAEIEYQRTLDTLNKARVTQGMTDGSKGISGEEYNQYVKLAQARRDAAIAKDAETKATLAAKSARDAEKISLEQEAAQIERLITLKRQEIQAEKSSSGSGGVRSTNTKQAEAELESYVQKLEQVRLRQSVTESSAEKMAQEFLQLKYSIDPTAKSLDALARKQDDLNKVFRANFIDEAEWKRLSGLIDKSRNSLLGLESSVDGVGDEFVKLRAQIDPAAAALEKVNVQQAKLNALYNSGKGSLPTAEYQRLNTILDQNRKRIADLGASTGKTAKEINFAMRGLPAQFTDIFVSLQGGQAPLTVLLQQGGQIKDMFGGVGPALKAMGSYILGLVNPLTVGAAALGAFALAAYQGSSEVSRLNKALILTGNTAKTTGSTLASSAAKIASDLNVSQGSVVSALDKVVSSGKFAVSSFEAVTKASVAFSRATGKSVEDIVSEFATLADKPSESILKLDEKYNFLTDSIYEQITALEAQGKTQEAARVAEDAYASTLETRAEQVIENLSFLESAWKGVTSQAKLSWDAMLGIGRPSDALSRIRELQKELNQGVPSFEAPEAPKMWWDYIPAVSLSKAGLNKAAGLFGPSEEEKKAELDRLLLNQKLVQEKERERKLDEQIRSERLAAASVLTSAANEAAKAEQGRVGELRKQLESVEYAYFSLQETAKGATKTQTQNYQSSVASLNKQIAEEEKRLAEQAKNRERRDNPAIRQTAADKLLSTILQQGAALQNQLETQGKVLTEENKLEKLKERIRIAEQAAAQGRATVDQKSIIASKDILLAEQQKNVELQKGIAAEQERVRLKNLQASIDARIASNQQKYNDRLVGVGMGDKEKERLRERLELQKNYDRELARLTKQRNERGNAGQSEFESGTAKLQAELTANQKALEENYAKMDAAQANWENGASAAWSNYLAEGKNVAGMTQSFFTSAFSSMEDALVGFVTTGKLSFKDLTVSILSDLAEMATKIAANQLIMSVIGSFAGAWSTGSGGASVSGYTGSAYSSWVAAQADGGGWNKGTQFFAKGGAFTNSVVSKPTAFGTGSGLGIMGEAGPEAIMPLTRTSDGQLGVKAAGGGGSTVVAPVSVTVNVSDSGAGSNSSSNNTEQQGRAVQMAIKSEVEKTIQIGLQPGGSIWRAMNNR